MKKKVSLLLIVFIMLISFTGCKKNDALLFKEDYESINDKESKSGKKHRSVTIDENNPFVISSAKEVVEKINNKDSFYVYFGSKICPWCRSVIEKAIETFTEENRTKILKKLCFENNFILNLLNNKFGKFVLNKAIKFMQMDLLNKFQNNLNNDIKFV